MNAIALPPRAQEIYDGKTPDRLRQAIAAGALPLPPEELLSCLAVIIARDPDASLRERATATLKELPAGVRGQAVRGAMAPPVFRVIWKLGALELAERQALALNNHVPDDVITDLARAENSDDVLTVLADNQQRMLRHVPLVEALLENPSVGPAMRARLEEFFSRAYAGKVMLQSGAITKEQLAAEDGWDPALSEMVANQAATEAPGVADLPPDMLASGDDLPLDDDAAQELIADATKDEHEAPDKITNLRKALQSMTVGQKIKLAIMGNKEARSLLAFDANKIVSSLVLKNARITEQEIKAIAASKSARDDLLRQIARDAKWMKSYGIKLSLVSNPKTPQRIALTLLAQMHDADLRKLSKSKGVSGQIQQQARRMVQRKQQQQSK